MRLHYLLFFLFGLPISVFCQKNASVDFILGIDYSHRMLSLENPNLPIDIVEMRDTAEFAKMNWRVGLNYNQRLSEKIFLKSGLRLASVGYKGAKQEGLRWPPPSARRAVPILGRRDSRGPDLRRWRRHRIATSRSSWTPRVRSARQ